MILDELDIVSDERSKRTDQSKSAKSTREAQSEKPKNGTKAPSSQKHKKRNGSFTDECAERSWWSLANVHCAHHGSHRENDAVASASKLQPRMLHVRVSCDERSA